MSMQKQETAKAAKRGTRSLIGKTAAQIVKRTLPRAKLAQIKDAVLENARLRTLLIENEQRMRQLISASQPDTEGGCSSKRPKKVGARRARLGLRCCCWAAKQAIARGAPHSSTSSVP